MEENPATSTARPLLYGIATFFLLFAITQFLAYQRYQVIKETERESLQHELDDTKSRFSEVLSHKISSANTVAIIYKQNHNLNDFNAIARQILEYDPTIDFINFAEKFTIKYVYPVAGNQIILGENMLDVPLFRKELEIAVKNKNIQFAGPYQLTNNRGAGIACRVPIFEADSLIGFVSIITKLSTINKVFPEFQNTNSKFVYRLSKINPLTNKRENFFPNYTPRKNSEISVYIPQGNWTLHVAYSSIYPESKDALAISLLGIILSLLVGVFIYYRAKLPAELKRIIASKTKQLVASEKYYRTLIETSSDAIVLLDATGGVLYQTPSTERITGYTLAEIQAIDGIELIHPDDRSSDSAVFANLVNMPGKEFHWRHRLKHKQGHYIWIDSTYRNLLNDKNVQAIVLNYYDVTDKVLSEHIIEKNNRELTLLNKINDIILRCHDKPELYKEVCDCIIVTGGYKLVWIGSMPSEDDNEQLVKPVYATGEVAYLDEIRISLSDPLLAKGPTATVLRTGKPVITNNVTNSETFKPWLDKASKFGISASCVLPLFVNSQIWGALNIYSGHINAFDAHESQILERLAFNVSLAIQNINTRNEKDKAEYLLKERIKELSTIFYVNEILKNDGQSVDEVFNKIVTLLPPGWQYPESCAAKAHFDGKDYVTENYRPSEYTQSSDFKLTDGRSGFIEIIYTEEKPVEYEGPFLKEERNLINILAETIAIYFNKKINQDALSGSEARFRSAFEHAAIGMAITSLENKWLMVNKSLANMLGYTEQELLNHTFIELTHPDDLGDSIKYSMQLLHEEIEYYRAYKRYIHKNGTIVWGNLNLALVRNENNIPLYYVSQIQDITAEIESQMKFRNLVEQSMVGVYIIQNGRFVYVNPQIIEDSGYTEAELLTSPFENFIADDDIEIVQENINNRKEGKPNASRYEIRTKQKNGAIVWREVFGTDTIYNGAPAIIGTMVNVTDRKRLELERQKIINDLVQRNRDLEQFAHIISHNVRAPLSTIIGLTGLLTGKQIKDEKEITVKGIVQSAEQLDMVIKDLNEILHIRKDLAELKSNINLNNIVEEVKSNLAKSINDTRAVIETDFAGVQELSAVRSYLHSIFYNLISNAIKYAYPDVPPLIRIWTVKKDNMIQLLFKDNGIGINLDKYGDQVFNMYKRFHLEVEGKGLGLFMVKTQVNALNGTIDIESTPGAGTTFTISFPV